MALMTTACGGGSKPTETPKAGAASADKLPPGFPSKHDEGWCDPMPDLGNSCAKELKECMIVCDYISDTCAMLVCMGGAWDYVERGEGANAGDE